LASALGCVDDAAAAVLFVDDKRGGGGEELCFTIGLRKVQQQGLAVEGGNVSLALFDPQHRTALSFPSMRRLHSHLASSCAASGSGGGGSRQGDVVLFPLVQRRHLSSKPLKEALAKVAQLMRRQINVFPKKYLALVRLFRELSTNKQATCSSYMYKRLSSLSLSCYF
jgi:hypothetical protein